MSESTEKGRDKVMPKAGPAYRVSGDGPWSHAWKVAGALGLLGLVAAGFGYTVDPRHFAFSWLFAFFVFLTIAMGSLFFVVLQHLVSAGWSVSVRRTAEFFAVGLPIFALLFVPIYLSREELYPWLSHGAEHESAERASTESGIAHAQEHPTGPEAAGPARRGVLPDEAAPDVSHHATIAKKHAYLNLSFWSARAVFYFAVWIILSIAFFTWSTRQDATKDPRWTVRAHATAPVAIILLALTLTFAAFDWLMSLDPSWFSTIFGVNIWASSMVAMFCTLSLVTLGLKSSGLVGDAINTEHFHDLGKLTFGFNVFWAYIGFSQMMLIWYASLPEETTFYHMRWQSAGWKAVSVLVVLGHFVAPFLMLISRHAKRRLTMFGFGTMWLLVMHVVDMYWFVMPHFRERSFEPHWLDLACLLGIGGIYLAVVFQRMTSHALIPIGDPRLERALGFQNA